MIGVHKFFNQEFFYPLGQDVYSYVRASDLLLRLIQKNLNWRPEEHKNWFVKLSPLLYARRTDHLPRLTALCCCVVCLLDSSSVQTGKHSHVYSYLQQRSTCLDCSAYWVGTLRPQNQTGIN